ncbi:hypothetical protein WH47_11062 [Habropoda laboriosa]|uniref:Uncharacterized protein n=1 Tax=Habropoda laboriosa TaxID=597456 RepID=A0A0L7QLE3_9HYME|nr:hypothetical protein WH47_11062 [Habropoda laboriosa]
MAESIIKSTDLIDIVDKEEVLNDPTTSMNKKENIEKQDISNENQLEVNNSCEEKLKIIGAAEVKDQKLCTDVEYSSKTENTVSENETHPKEGITTNARLSETGSEEKSKKMDNSSTKVKDMKNTISEEEETLNEILKVVHENVSSTEVRQSTMQSKNLEQEKKNNIEEPKVMTDGDLRTENIMETVNDKINVLAETEVVTSRRDTKIKQSIETVDHMEVGIVGPPTIVSELINEEELRAESALSTDQKVQDHIAEWVQNSAKVEELVIEEEKTPIRDGRQEKNFREKRTRKKKSNDVLALPTRKSQRIVSNIIKKSIKW